MALKVITIDFWNTLFDSSNSQERNKYRNQAIYKTIIEQGIEITEKQIRDGISASWAHFNENWIKNMRTPLPRETVEFFWDFLKIPHNDESIEKIVKLFETIILDYPPQLMPDAGRALEILSKKYKIGLISDTGFTPGKILKLVMQKNEILDFFEAFSFSDETGVAKPHPEAYLKILRKLDCPPENALHIGDIEQTDIEGALRLGMKAIRFSGDPTYLSAPNPKKTRGTAECNNWAEVIDKIEEIDNNSQFDFNNYKD